MKKSIMMITLVCSLWLAVSFAAESFSRDQFPQGNQHVTSQGRVLTVTNTSRGVMLKIGNSLKDCLNVIIPQSDVERFPENPRAYYRNRSLQVMGMLKSYRGIPELIVTNPSQLVIVDNMVVVPPTVSSPDVTQLLGRISTLENIVRELSKQVTKLKSNAPAHTGRNRNRAQPDSELLMDLNKRVRDIEHYLATHDRG